jgi:hypothetical protein
MQAAGRIADQFPQPVLDMHVDVLQRRVFPQLAGLDLRRDPQQSFLNRLGVFRRQNVLAGQHRRMGAAGEDVLAPQSLVDGDGGIYLTHDGGRSAGKAPAPHLIGIARAADRPSPDPCCDAVGRGLR